MPAWIAVAAVALPVPHRQRPQLSVPPDTAPAFRNPTGIAVGRDGLVVIASQGDSSVVVYAPGASGGADPLRRIGPSSGLISPQAVALDARGQLVVSTGPKQTKGGSITVYAPGASGDAAPVRVIAGTGPGLDKPAGLALGPQGRLYVLNGRGRSTVNSNGIELGDAAAVVVFDALASDDARPERTLHDVIDTIVTPPPPPPAPSPAPVKVVDTVCAKPPPSSGSTICQIVERLERRPEPFLFGRPFMQSTSRQRPDTVRPLDVATGPDGGPLVLTTRGVTAYDRSLVRHGKPYSRRPPETQESEPDRFPGARIAVGPAGELFVARRAGGLMLFGKKSSPGKTTDLDSLRESWFGRASIAVHAPRRYADSAVRIIGGRKANLDVVADLVVGRDGSLYALCAAGSGKRRIAVFGPGADGDVAPIRIIEGPGLDGAISLALGPSGAIYVANDRSAEDPVFGSGVITVYAADAAGTATPIRTIAGWSTGLNRPRAIAVAADGTIYVANLDVYTDDHGSVRTFAAQAAEGERGVQTLMGRATRFAGPQGVAIHHADTLYVLSSRLARITMYPPAAAGGAPPMRTLEGPATELRGSGWFHYGPELPSQIAVDSAGQLYVSDPMQASGLDAYGPDLGAIRVYRRGADGNDAPIRRIRGGYTRLNGPGGIAIDRQGRLYVANRYGTGRGSVTVYDAKADGDVRPSRMLAGPATGLLAPAAVALDRHDTLYVVNAASVTVYAPGAAANAAPVRIIEAYSDERSARK